MHAGVCVWGDPTTWRVSGKQMYDKDESSIINMMEPVGLFYSYLHFTYSYAKNGYITHNN